MESSTATKDITENKLQVSLKIFKILSLVCSGLTGFLALGIFIIMVAMLEDAQYQQMIQINNIVGYICAACALITIVVTVIFKNNNLVFMISTFITAVLGSLQFVIFVASPFRDMYPHYISIIPVVMSVLSIAFFFVHIVQTKRRNR